MTYRATTAQWHAERSACRPKQAKLMWNKALHSYVQDRLSGIIMTSKRCSGCRPGRIMERTKARSAAASPLGARLEP